MTKLITLLTVVLAMTIGVANAGDGKGKGKDKEKALPPGLQKKVAEGKPLPPGWQKKLEVGHTLDKDIYQRGKVLDRTDDGTVAIQVEDKVIRVIEDTREIVGILERF
ncbi:hypothetical protein P2G88_17250 [Aliiglaciecola sp. CAU 1673]|uniref:hypothetical protein n=1 Tax=Aliiglaciecola sp. CAU 1673 TaxID=3032595 RepID=UPI0023DC81BA|nr:hypothetical protein [Aliiglaciecola sp. CAU 1673]MDF2180004.1 hypothetical protein [Aliiglaciecola sp. CAU 1673]